MSCVRCERNPLSNTLVPIFDALLEGRFLKLTFDLTGSIPIVADTLARETLTYKAEWATKVPQPIIFFRYEKDTKEWKASGQHFLNFFNANEPGGDRKDRFAEAEKGMLKNGQAIVISEDLGEGWNKGYIYIYTDVGDHIEGVAYEHRGGDDALLQTQKKLSEHMGHIGPVDFNTPLFSHDKILTPDDILHAIEQGFDENVKQTQQEYLLRMDKAVNQFSLLKQQYEDNVAELAKQKEEEFIRSDIGVKLFSDTAQAMVQSLEKTAIVSRVETVVEQGREAEKEPATREPASEIMESITVAASKAGRDTVNTIASAGALVIEHMKLNRQEKQKTGKEEPEKRTPKIKQYQYQFVYHVPIGKSDTKAVRKDFSPLRSSPRAREIIMPVSLVLKKKLRSRVKQPDNSALVRPEAKKRLFAQLFTQEATNKKVERKFSSPRIQNSLKEKQIKISGKEKILRKKEFRRKELLTKKKEISRRIKEVFSPKKKTIKEILSIFVRFLEQKQFIKEKNRKRIRRLSSRKFLQERKSLSSTMEYKHVVLQFAIVWILWVFLREPKMQKSPKALRNMNSSVLEKIRNKDKKLKPFIAKEEIQWVLLAIIWYLVMIREQGMKRGYQKNHKKRGNRRLQSGLSPVRPLAPSGVIFAFAPAPDPQGGSVRDFASRNNVFEAHFVI